jgi:hypothetical protein
VLRWELVLDDRREVLAEAYVDRRLSTAMESSHVLDELMREALGVFG